MTQPGQHRANLVTLALWIPACAGMSGVWRSWACRRREAHLGRGLGFGCGCGARGLAPDPRPLRAIAERTGGKFYRAKSAGAAEAAYSTLGSKLGRQPGSVEVTSWFLIGAAALLVLAGVMSTLWSPRLP